MDKLKLCVCIVLGVVTACVILVVIYSLPKHEEKVETEISTETSIECMFSNKTIGKCVKRELCPDKSHQIMVRFGADMGKTCETEEENVICCALEAVDIPEIPRSKRDLLNTKTCGFMGVERIFGGQSAAPGEFNFYAALMYKVNDTIKALCGGSLITARYVLTAAHCLKEIPVAVRVGSTDLTKDRDCEDCDPAASYGVGKVIVHEDFTVQNGNDIGLVRLKTELVFGANIKTICLPLEKSNLLSTLTGKNFIVMGFGKTENNKLSDRLLKTLVLFVPSDECQPHYARTNIQVFHDGFLCAGGGRNDSCKGDSGSPLINFSEIDGKHHAFQYGIVSVGIKCGGKPAIYTKVENYMDWIMEKIEF